MVCKHSSNSFQSNFEGKKLQQQHLWVRFMNRAKKCKKQITRTKHCFFHEDTKNENNYEVNWNDLFLLMRN